MCLCGESYVANGNHRDTENTEDPQRRNRVQKVMRKQITKQNLFRISLAAAFLSCVLWLPLGVTGQRGSTSSLRPEHRAIVEQWLKLRPDLRIATDADNTNKEGLAATRNERGRNYHPYYAVGDFNGDKKEDFAVALVRKKKSRWPFVFAIFNGPVAGATKPTFTEDADISNGGIFYNPQNPPRGFRLAVGTFQSDDCVIFSPRGRTYLGRACLE
jgi:hypothetical protein